MGRDEMRAGDADREAVAERLRSALSEGRLDLHEYDERLQRAYAAKTYGELDPLLADLPATVPVQRSAMAVPDATADVAVTGAEVRYPDATRRWLAENWGGYLGVIGICVTIWLVGAISHGNLEYFWPIWVIGPWGAILVASTISGLVSGEPQRWAAKQERKKAAKRERRELRERQRREGGPAAIDKHA